MSQFNQPETLAYAASEKLAEAATKITTQNRVMKLAVGGMSVGMIAAGAGVMPALALMTVYSLWDLKQTRDQSVKLRNAFNEMSSGLGDHDSVHQLDPLSRVFAKVHGFNKNDLNLADHFKKNKNTTLLFGAIALLAPLLAPMLLASLINDTDIKHLSKVKGATQESKKNLQQKYPLTFSPD